MADEVAIFRGLDDAGQVLPPSVPRPPARRVASPRGLAEVTVGSARKGRAVMAVAGAQTVLMGGFFIGLSGGWKPGSRLSSAALVGGMALASAGVAGISWWISEFWDA